MLRKKLCKMLAALMVSTIVLGNSVQAVGATVVETIASEGENQGNVLADGTYKITNKTYRGKAQGIGCFAPGTIS